MTTATKYNIVPYFSKVECSYCHHRYIPRSHNPLVCPKCGKPFLAIIITEFEELREKLIQTQRIKEGR